MYSYLSGTGKTDTGDDRPVRNELSLKWNDTGAKEVFTLR